MEQPSNIIMCIWEYHVVSKSCLKCIRIKLFSFICVSGCCSPQFMYSEMMVHSQFVSNSVGEIVMLIKAKGMHVPFLN